MAADSWGVMGMFWGLSACVHVSRSRRSSMSGGAAGGVIHGSVHVRGWKCAFVSQGAVRLSPWICRLASTLLVGMSC
jgi:hypothetical protein